MALLHGKGANVYITSTPSVSRTTQAMTDSGDHKRYYVTNPVYRFWDTEKAVTVYKNSNPITTGFTVEYAGGQILFDSANLGGDVITASFYNYPYAKVAEAYNWSFSSTQTKVETTVFGLTGVRRAAGTHDYGVSFGSYHQYGGFFTQSIGGLLYAFTLHEKGTYDSDHSHGPCYEGYGFVSFKLDSSGTDMMKDSVTVESHLPWYYHTLPA